MKENKAWLIWLIAAGGFLGLAAVALTYFGNPANMGLCVACFLRDISGALGLHGAAKVQYIRPEIIGLILGAFAMSVFTREFRPTGGSAPLLRFVISVFVMIGALVFLGCPLRMVLRLAAGDANALVALAGFAAGIGAGGVFLKLGFSFGRSQPQPRASGFILPAFAVALLAFLLVRPVFIKFSEEGPGSMHAPLLIALAAGLIAGALAQRSRLCMAGGIRDLLLIRSPLLLTGYIATFVVALIGNLALGKFNFGFIGQPVAHSMHLWNFLGMALVGLGSVLLGGCPLRQVILASEGNADSAISVLGLIVGAAVSHNFGLAGVAGSADAPAGSVPMNGQIAVLVGFAVIFVIALMGLKKKGVAKA